MISLRRHFLDESERTRFIASSVLDLEWIDQLPQANGARFLFIAEGLFMYLPPEGVRTLVVTPRERFPGAELVAEFASLRTVRLLNSRVGRGKLRRQFSLSDNVTYSFGINDARELEHWGPGIALLDEWSYFDEDEPRLGWFRWLARWPLFSHAQWTARYRPGDARTPDVQQGHPADAARGEVRSAEDASGAPRS